MQARRSASPRSTAIPATDAISSAHAARCRKQPPDAPPRGTASGDGATGLVTTTDAGGRSAVARACLAAMDIDVWQRRRGTKAGGSGPEVDADAAAALAVLQREVSGCTRCPLHASRTQTVFGAGSPVAEWLFVGEAPGAEEDRQGVPFVGRAGQLLTAMLAALGIARDEVYIANVLKCRPPRNRDPMGEEVQSCEPYLLRQVELVAPRLIIAMGRFAAQSLLKTTRTIGELRGRRWEFGDTGIPLVVTYHPAYLLRNPIDKRKAWEDLCLARRISLGS